MSGRGPRWRWPNLSSRGIRPLVLVFPGRVNPRTNMVTLSEESGTSDDKHVFICFSQAMSRPSTKPIRLPTLVPKHAWRFRVPLQSQIGRHSLHCSTKPLATVRCWHCRINVSGVNIPKDIGGGGALILVEKGSPPTSKQIAAGDNSTSSIADVRSSSMLTFQSFQYTFHALASDNNKRQNWNKWSTYRKRRSEEQASRCLIENDGKEAIDLLH